jgi:hypothetical protein
MDSRIKAALVRAREKIAQGWVQYTGQDHDGNVCTSFALNAAAAEVLVARSTLSCQVANDAAEVMFQAIIELTGEDWSRNIVGWNDYRGRTQDEVLHTFDHAIKLAERDNL